MPISADRKSYKYALTPNDHGILTVKCHSSFYDDSFANGETILREPDFERGT